MSDRWLNFFKNKGVFNNSWLKGAVDHWIFHSVLYGIILRYCPPPARILDIGCGPGWSALYLSSLGYEVVGIDNEPKLIKLACELSDRLVIQTEFKCADAFDLSQFYEKFDLVYSCGVLEHFDREVTVLLLREQAKCAPRVLVQIPTKYTAYTGEITDERIYTIGELRQIVKDAGLHPRVSFGYGDVVATPIQHWLRRLLPQGAWRWLQNRGFAYSIAVLGERP